MGNKWSLEIALQDGLVYISSRFQSGANWEDQFLNIH